MVMETEKSHDLPCTSWRTRKDSGIIQYNSKGLRTRGADDVTTSLSLRPENQMGRGDGVSPGFQRFKNWEL